MKNDKEAKSLQPKVVHKDAVDPNGQSPVNIFRDDMSEYDRRAEKESAKRVIQPSIEIAIKEKGPFLVAQLGDLHIGHEATDHKLIDKWFDWVRKNDAFAVLYGDMGEGFNPEYAGTNSAALVATPESQDSTIHSLLESLIEDRDLLGIVPSMEHEEWMKKHSGKSTYNRKYLRGYVVENGGRVVLTYPGGLQEVLSISHNAGKGGSDDNPLGALFELSTKKRGVDAFGAGHNHSRGGVGIRVGLASSKDPDGKRTAFFVTGTFKGLKPGRRDLLLNSENVQPVPPGALTVHSKKLGMTPVPTREHAEVLVDAERIWEAAMSRRGNKDALLEDIWKKGKVDQQRPELRSVGPGGSEKRKASAKHPEETAHWKRVTVAVPGVLPYQLYTLAGLRIGDKTADFDQLKHILTAVSEHKRSYMYLGRQMVDKATPRDVDRRRFINDLVKRFKDFGGLTDAEAKDPRILAVLYDSVLRNEAWKATIHGAWTEDEDGDPVRRTSEKFFAATAIEESLKVPMLDNKGIIVKEGKWNGHNGSSERTRVHKDRVFDNMESASSRKNSYAGTVAMLNYDVAGGAEICDSYIGATKPISGVFQLYNQAYGGYVTHINPGYLAEWQHTKTNAQEAPPSGQSEIIDPVTGLVFVGATLPHSVGLHEALTMKAGIERVLKSDTAANWKRRLGVTSRTHFT